MVTKERLEEIAKTVFNIMIEKRAIDVGDRVYIWNMFNVDMEGKAKILPEKEYMSKKEFIVTEIHVDFVAPIKALHMVFDFDLVLYDPETKETFRSSKMNVRIVDDNKILPHDVIHLTESEKEEIYNILKPKKRINPILN